MEEKLGIATNISKVSLQPSPQMRSEGGGKPRETEATFASAWVQAILPGLGADAPLGPHQSSFSCKVIFCGVEDLQDLPRHFLVFARHLLCFPGQVGKDVMQAGEVQVELGF